MYRKLAKHWNGRDKISETLWNRIRQDLTPGMFTLEIGSGLSTWLFVAAGCWHTAIEIEPDHYLRTIEKPFHGNVVELRDEIVLGDGYDLIYLRLTEADITYIEEITEADIIYIEDVTRNSDMKIAEELRDRLGKEMDLFETDMGRLAARLS